MANMHKDVNNRNDPPVILGSAVVAPGTGVSLVIPDGLDSFYVNMAADIATLTLKTPLKPYPDQPLTIVFAHAVTTTFTLNPNTSQAFIITPPTTITAGQVLKLKWRAQEGKWWPN